MNGPNKDRNRNVLIAWLKYLGLFISLYSSMEYKTVFHLKRKFALKSLTIWTGRRNRRLKMIVMKLSLQSNQTG